jgi:hypothetical protein
MQKTVSKTEFASCSIAVMVLPAIQVVSTMIRTIFDQIAEWQPWFAIGKFTGWMPGSSASLDFGV